MKKGLICILLAAFILSACSAQASSEGSPKIIRDALAREVILEDVPQDIVVAGKQTPMLVNFIYLFENAPERIRAIENRSQSGIEFITLLDERIQDKYTLEKGAGAEQIAPANPDLVILKSSMQDTIGVQLEAIHIPVVYVDFESIEDIYRDVRILGNIFDEEERGEEIVSRYESWFNAIQETIQTEDAGSKETVLMIQAVDEDQKFSFNVPPDEWLQTALVEEAGAEPIWKGQDFAGGWTEINFEQIAAWDPDYIFIINYQGNGLQIQQELSQDPLWQELTAVQEKQLKAFPFDFISWDQPDPRWILGFQWINEQVHPDMDFKPNLQELTVDFYSAFYGLDEDTISEKIFPLYLSHS